ncbi:folate-sensitive fragile site protein Fra10Ac1-domain-containing protein [Pisolithus croceorrhizus]|nr:folate-sensitive fragile site protein Fra10Ac1-domain-containing protein [Pisolithus croceorrhizus]
MSLYKLYYTSRSVEKRTQEVPVTEFDILKASHKFLRDDVEQAGSSTNNASSSSSSWNDQLAKKYYDTLYREFALCNLKHYKSGNFALRWRTENEVLDGTGETTCANMRCEYHRPHSPSNSSPPALSTLELPFAYEERGEVKQALVKVVLCPGCLKKLMWKRNREKRLSAKGKDVEEGNGDTNDKRVHDEDRSEPGDDSGSGKRREIPSRPRSRSRSPRSHERKRGRREDTSHRSSSSRKRLREHGGETGS